MTSSKKRELSKTEKEIIQRDLDQQRSIKESLNSRASFIAALAGIEFAGMGSLTVKTFPILGVILYVILVFTALGFLEYSFGEYYWYPVKSKEWVRWTDERLSELIDLNLNDPLTRTESDLSNAYWDQALAHSELNRDSNRKKEEIVQRMGVMTAIVLLTVVFVELLGMLVRV